MNTKIILIKTIINKIIIMMMKNITIKIINHNKIIILDMKINKDIIIINHLIYNIVTHNNLNQYSHNKQFIHNLI